MTSRPLHHVTIPYLPDYPDLLVVCCSDGRYIEAVGAFLAGQGTPRYDLLCRPGGPAILCSTTVSAYQHRVATDAFDFLVTSHRTRRVLLIAHQDCGLYVQRFGVARREKQVDDVRSARAWILKRHPQIDVSMYFVRPHNVPQHGFLLEEIGFGEDD